jgi:hypothetical protein
VKLEQAEALLSIDRRAAAVALAEAAELSAGLYGRSEPLDDFLRRARKQSLSLVAADEVGPVVEEFRGLLAGLPLSE